MKFLKALAATACALALASAVQAATYTDSSDNYELNHMLATGDNGGDGFGAWEIETHGSGIDGAWAGCGIWDPSANNFQGDWAGKTKAFGIIGKGDGYGANAYRPFRAPLAVGDSFSLEMGVNWDSNAGIDALKGFALLAKGGTLQVLTINHRSNPGAIAINGETDDILNIDEGTYPMKWTFTAKDATTLTVTMTPRDGSKTIYEKDWTVDTSALDGFRLQSSNQNPYEDEKAAEERGETAQMWADRRQTYFDNFTLDVAADLPDLLDLEFTDGEYAVTSNNQELSYTLKRPSSDGELTVNVKSSFEAFIPSTTATFADGESETTFTVTATLQPKVENKANLTVSALGFNPAVYENVRAPRYRFSSDTASVGMGETANIWVNWDDNGVRDDSKLAFVADPEDIVTLPASFEITDEAKDGGGNYIGLYGQTSISGVAAGYTLLSLTYDGVVVGDWGFTVPAPVVPGFELSGPATAKTGAAAVFTLKATLDGAEEGCSVSVEPADGVTVDPVSFDLVEPAENGFYYQDIEVTFENPGDYTITAKSHNYSAELSVSVSEPADFSDYIAYDDASLYGGNFDFDATGEGSDGFQPWTVWKADAQYGSAIVTDADGGFPAILSDGSALAIYANGENPAYAIVRPFVNDLQPGQKASIEFVAPQEGGYRKIYFSRIWEGTPYNRFQVWASGGKVGVTVEDGDDTELSWSENSRRIVASVELAADGSSYTLSLAGYNEGSEFADDVFQYSIGSDVGSWGDGIQGIAIDGWDLPNDFLFNRLAIEQVEEPVVTRAIGWGEGVYNPEGDGTYTITLTATTTDIGEVAIAVEPADGVLSLESDTVDFAGGTSATITYTLSGANAGDSFRISATPIDTDVAPLTGEGAYGVTVTAPAIGWGDGVYNPEGDGTYTITLTANTATIGIVNISVDPADGALSLASDTVDFAGGTSATITYVLSGSSVGEFFRINAVPANTAVAPLEGDAGYGVTVVAPSAPIVLPSVSVVTSSKGRGLAFSAEALGRASLVGAYTLLGEVDWTKLVENEDYVVEDGKVVVLFDGKFFKGQNVGFVAAQ